MANRRSVMYDMSRLYPPTSILRRCLDTKVRRIELLVISLINWSWKLVCLMIGTLAVSSLEDLNPISVDKSESF